MAVPAEIAKRVRERANGVCEYCRLPQAAYPRGFEVDHVIAEQHGGATRMSNLCISCGRCNRSKGPNIAGIDKKSRQVTPLLHPRRDDWDEHFAWRGVRLVGLTPVGRVTIKVLSITHPDAIRLRGELRREGLFPPQP
jgi:5-methylcytosine-specific restriction endonuclease McrA